MGWTLATILISFGTYRYLRFPSPIAGWFSPYFALVVLGFCFWFTFDAYRCELDSRNSDCLMSEDSAGYDSGRTGGLQLICLGLFLIGGVAALIVQEWKIAHWPEATAIVVAQNIKDGVVELTFDLAVNNEHFLGYATQWDQGQFCPSPGTFFRLRYNPTNPSQITSEWNDWKTGRADRLLILFGITGLFLIATGAKSI